MKAGLRIEILDEQFSGIAGYSGDDAAILDADDYDVEVRWNRAAAYISDGRPVYLSVRFLGDRPEDARLHALYVK